MRILVRIIIIVTIWIKSSHTRPAADSDKILGRENDKYCAKSEDELEKEWMTEERHDLFEGDIAMDRKTAKQIVDNSVETRDVLANEELRWKTNRIPYVFDKSVGTYLQNVVKAAIQDFEKYSCVNFIPRSTEKDYLNIYVGKGCWSYVGRMSGKQEVSFGPGCEYKGTVIHEFMHALGFFHEHTRLDRDEYVTIDWTKVKQGMENNFRKYAHGMAEYLGEKYDYSSIMHYPKLAFSKDQKSFTITPKKATTAEIGQRKGFSEIDLKQLNKSFKCFDKDKDTATTTAKPTAKPSVPTTAAQGKSTKPSEKSVSPTTTIIPANPTTERPSVVVVVPSPAPPPVIAPIAATPKPIVVIPPPPAVPAPAVVAGSGAPGTDQSTGQPVVVIPPPPAVPAPVVAPGSNSGSPTPETDLSTGQPPVVVIPPPPAVPGPAPVVAPESNSGLDSGSPTPDTDQSTSQPNVIPPPPPPAPVVVPGSNSGSDSGSDSDSSAKPTTEAPTSRPNLITISAPGSASALAPSSTGIDPARPSIIIIHRPRPMSLLNPPPSSLLPIQVPANCINPCSSSLLPGATSNQQVIEPTTSPAGYLNNNVFDNSKENVQYQVPSPPDPRVAFQASAAPAPAVVIHVHRHGQKPQDNSDLYTQSGHVTKEFDYPTWPGDFRWSKNGVPVCDCNCLNIAEPLSEGYLKSKNSYLCTHRRTLDPGLRWSHKGPIHGKRCIRISHPNAPGYWHNNYLCVPRESPYKFIWSFSGPIKAKNISCIKMDIPIKQADDSYYLCAKKYPSE